MATFLQNHYGVIAGPASMADELTSLGCVLSQYDTQRQAFHAEVSPYSIRALKAQYPDRVSYLVASQSPSDELSWAIYTMADEHLAHEKKFEQARSDWLRHCRPDMPGGTVHDTVARVQRYGKTVRQAHIEFELEFRAKWQRTIQAEPALATLHWARVAVKNCVEYRLLNEQKQVVAADVLSDVAIAKARQTLLAAMPPWRQTFDEFKQNTLAIDVVEGKGKTGLAKHGPTRLLTSEWEDLAALKVMLGQSYDQRGYASDPESAQKEEWINNSVSNLLQLAGTGELVFYSGAEAACKNILLVKSSFRFSLDTALRTLYRDELTQAMQNGESIPQSIRDANPFLAELEEQMLIGDGMSMT